MQEVQHIINKNKEAVIIPDGIIVIDRKLEIIVFNEAASRITGFAEDEIIGKTCSILFFPEAIEGYHLIEDSLSTNTVYANLSLYIKSKDSIKKNTLISITPILKDNEVLNVVFVFRDLQEMLKLNAELESTTSELIDQKNRLDAIFNSNIEGTFTIDNNWNITSFNKSAENITGYKMNQAIGKKCWEIFKSSVCRNGCHMERTMSHGEAMIGNDVEIHHISGRKIPIKINSGILKNNKNENIGAVETFIDISEIKNLSSHLSEIFEFENIIGHNKEIRQVFNLLESVSQTDSTVLITGESGTGKELAARAIHLKSNRKSAPFIAVNCSAYVETLIESELFGHEKGAFTGAIKNKVGKFEQAEKGTLFLDEIGDLSFSVQTKLLRIIENKEFEKVGSNKIVKMDVRVIAATNKNLSEEIKLGKFREDLFYRINVINIQLPPLRERMDDLPFLVNHFIKKFNLRFSKKIKQFSSKALDALMEYKWPGNIRELENAIEHCYVICNCEVIQFECLPKRIRDAVSNQGVFEYSNNVKNFNDAEINLIIKVLKKNNWNKAKTAKELNINTSTLWRKMKKYQIINPRFED